MKLSKDEVAQYIEDFLNGTGGRWDWDDFISVPINDPDPDKIRVLAVGLPDRFPPTRPGHYCGEQGTAELRQILRTLRIDRATTTQAESP
jgi:hypothetical protein